MNYSKRAMSLIVLMGVTLLSADVWAQTANVRTQSGAKNSDLSTKIGPFLQSSLGFPRIIAGIAGLRVNLDLGYVQPSVAVGAGATQKANCLLFCHEDNEHESVGLLTGSAGFIWLWTPDRRWSGVIDTRGGVIAELNGRDPGVIGVVEQSIGFRHRSGSSGPEVSLSVGGQVQFVEGNLGGFAAICTLGINFDI